MALLAPQGGDLGRLAQLVAKTNQFTLDQPRHSEAELAAIVADGKHAVRLVRAADRFGDYGVIGAFIVHEGRLDTFVLSCRAMGRGIEDAMLAAAGEGAGGTLTVTVHAGARNVPARSFFERFGAGAGSDQRITTPAWPSFVRREEG